MAPTRVTKFVQGALAVIALGSVQRASALWISYGEEVISEGVADVFDVELYLAQFGLAYSLPLLEVTYEGNNFAVIVPDGVQPGNAFQVRLPRLQQGDV